jgi:hypothetical protein
MVTTGKETEGPQWQQKPGLTGQLLDDYIVVSIASCPYLILPSVCTIGIQSSENDHGVEVSIIRINL